MLTACPFDSSLYPFIGRFVVDARARRGIAYAVTDKRVLIQRSAPLKRGSSQIRRPSPAT